MKHVKSMTEVFLFLFLGEFFDLCADTNLQERTKNKRHFPETPRILQGSLNYIITHFLVGIKLDANLMVILMDFSSKNRAFFFGLVSRVLGSRLPLFIKPKPTPIVRVPGFQVTLLTRFVTSTTANHHSSAPIHHHFGKMFHIFSFLPTTKTSKSEVFQVG